MVIQIPASFMQWRVLSIAGMLLVVDAQGEPGRVMHDYFQNLFQEVQGEYGPVVDCLVQEF